MNKNLNDSFWNKIKTLIKLYHLNFLWNLVGKEYLSDEEIEKNPPKYDIYVSGSDQIWNVNFRIASRAYFLAFAKSDKKFAFASSVGRCQIDKLEAYKPFIMDYNKIFIREEYLASSYSADLTPSISVIIWPSSSVAFSLPLSTSKHRYTSLTPWCTSMICILV